MEKTLANQKDHLQRRLRRIILQGGKCARCSERNFVELDIHHTDGGGTRERQAAGGGSNSGRKEVKFYRTKGRAPDRLELLCFKCHAMERKTAANRVFLSTIQACNILELTREELYGHVIACRIEARPVTNARDHNRYEFKAQWILDFACLRDGKHQPTPKN